MSYGNKYNPSDSDALEATLNAVKSALDADATIAASAIVNRHLAALDEYRTKGADDE